MLFWIASILVGSPRFFDFSIIHWIKLGTHILFNRWEQIYAIFLNYVIQIIYG